MASRGTLWASARTWAYLALLGLTLAAAVAARSRVGAAWSWVVGLVALVALGVLAQLRSRVARRAFDRALFHGRPLPSLRTSVDHVICSADLQTAELVYFSGRFVHAWRLGWGIPADLSLASAVRASAALAGLFSAVSLPVARHRFGGEPASGASGSPTGAYDNMGPSGRCASAPDPRGWSARATTAPGRRAGGRQCVGRSPGHAPPRRRCPAPGRDHRAAGRQGRAL